MEIFSFLNSESFGNYVLVAAAIGFVVAHIAALTPNKTDNKWVAWGQDRDWETNCRSN